MTVKEGLALIRQLNKGYVHSIWTFKTPFIGGCATAPRGLSGLVATIDYDVPVLHKSSRRCVVPELCSGCGVCLPRCYFQALQISSHAVIDGARCYGCGLCAKVCPRKAITMASRLPDSTTGHELSFG